MTKPTDETMPVTRQELEAAIAKLATKADLERFATKADLERFATKADLEVVTTIIVARMDKQRDDLLAHVDRRSDELHTDLARWIRAAEEQTASNARILDEKYRDLPSRVARLEAKVFAPRRGRGRP